MKTNLLSPRRSTVPFLNRSLALFCAAIGLAACGHKGALNGTYASSVQSYTFEGDTASASVMGKTIGEKWPYSVEGKKVTLKGPGGEVVLTINEDGSLSDPAHDKLIKK